MALTTSFLVNVLCSFVSCDPTRAPPDIMETLETSASEIFEQDFSLSPHVDLRFGRLEGYTMKTIGNRKIYAFEGVPYAEPPVGYQRFRPAVPKEPWRGVREAKKPGPECLQLSPPKVLRVLGNEDCLYLNVYTPQIPYINENGDQVFFESLPVILWIHGGSYYYGSGSDVGPSYLLDRDVILVTFNYRLGVLGFLSTGDSASPGNIGLKDQAMVIQWVYENIASFGGDPYKITIIGQNAGASSAHLHLLANKTAEYFQSGISLSGSAYSYWALKSANDSKRLTTQIAQALNCRTDNSEILVECLREKNPVDVVSAQFKLLEWAPFPATLFSPVIEPHGPDAYLTRTPDAVYARQQLQKKPWIFSMTAQEGYFGLMYLRSFFSEMPLRFRWEELAPIFLDYKYTAKNVNATTHKLSKFYFGRHTSVNVPQNKIAALFGDRLIMPSIHKSIMAHSSIAPTYAYIFGYKGKYNLGNLVGTKSSEWGVGHMEDLFYYFNSTFYYNGFKKDDVDEYALCKIMTSMLANFASKGEPLFSQTNKIPVRVWETVNPKDVRFLQINTDIKMIPEPFRKRLRFWFQLAQEEPTVVNPLFEF